MKDTRSLPPEAKEALRLRAMRAYFQGEETQGQIARTFGVARQTVCGWCQTYHKQGEAGLKARKVGCKPGFGLLGPEREERIHTLIETWTPDALGLPFDLWTRRAVRDLIHQQFGLLVPVRTVGKWLKKWGFTPQKPIRRALEQDSQAAQHGSQEEYPQVERKAQAEGAEIQWCDQMGLHHDDGAGRSYSPRGQQPVVVSSARRCRCNLIASMTNNGLLRFMVFSQLFTAAVFQDFLSRLIRQAERKIYLIVDRHPVHRAQAVQEWLKQHEEQICLILLPAYSPELNPVEYLNQDVKANVSRFPRPRSQPELEANVRGCMHSTQKHPEIVQSFFRAPEVQYALPVSANMGPE